MTSLSIWGNASGRDRKLFKHILATLIAVGVAFTAVLLVEWLVLATDPGLRQFGADVTKRGKQKGGGALVICGGGRLPNEVRDRFVELAGGRKAKLVVIPTAHPSADGPDAFHSLDVWKSCGVASVTLLHTRSRERANDTRFTQPLTDATGVWLGGGKQTWLTDVYAGTEVERQLKALLARGGVIGGSSAGAAVMTRVMIAGGRAEVKEARGFDLLPGAIVDQHFMKRNRVSRLLEVLTRHPGLVGFGIDEQTALVVRGKRLSVIGNSYVMACLPGSSGHLPRIEVLKRGDETDLAALSGPTVAITSAMGLDEVLAPFSEN